MVCKIGIIIYALLQFAAFLFILVGTPIGQFTAKNIAFWSSSDSCVSFWGLKNRCYSTKYDIRTRTLWEACPARRTRFEAAEAFSIISIAVFGLAALFGFIMLCCCSCFRWVCLVLNILGTVTACVCWGCMVSEFYTDRDPCPKINIIMKYGAGFTLFVVGWCLNIVNILFLMLPC